MKTDFVYFNHSSFLQSQEWGEFQRSLGNEVERIVVNERGQKAILQCYTIKSKLFRYLYCPRGPLAASDTIFSQLLSKLQDEAKNKSIDFILIETDANSKPFLPILLAHGFLKQPRSIQPQHTSIVSLTQNSEILFSHIRKTTRALINKAMRNKIIIQSYSDLSRWDEFAKLLTETTKRQQFTAHSLGYLKKQFECFAKSDSIKLYLASINKKASASAIILTYQKTTTYLHAASSIEGRNSGASHLLVWQAMQDAKQNGNELFDLWGIAPNDDPNHPWAGITTFKKGFGGETVSYPGAFVFKIRPFPFYLYGLTSFLRSNPIFKNAQRVLLSNTTIG